MENLLPVKQYMWVFSSYRNKVNGWSNPGRRENLIFLLHCKYTNSDWNFHTNKNANEAVKLNRKHAIIM